MKTNEYHHTIEQVKAEADIIDMAKKDPVKFAPLYDKYHDQIFMFILKRVETTEIAKDITSQVFLKALVNISKYNHQNLPLASWLYRIARNEVFTLHKKKKIVMVVSIEQEGISDMISENKEECREEDIVKMKMAFKKLTGDELEMIEMRFFEKKPFREIAEILELTETNAKVKTHRILDKLKTLMRHGR